MPDRRGETTVTATTITTATITPTATTTALSRCLTNVKGAPREPSGMIVLAESMSLPANATGIVVGVVSIAITLAWLTYLYR